MILMLHDNLKKAKWEYVIKQLFDADLSRVSFFKHYSSHHREMDYTDVKYNVNYVMGVLVTIWKNIPSIN